ncbi:MAG: polyprenyl synthetase family protein [Candidatus Omnitrophota bacterium]
MYERIYPEQSEGSLNHLSISMLKKLKKDVDKALGAYLKELKTDLNMGRVSPLLYGGIKDFLQRDGKRIRPILFLISYQGYTRRKQFSYQKLLRSSLSLELLHDFFLVHDDVIDNSDLRRGKPTLHRLFNTALGVGAKNELGPNLSIAAGDIIFALAVKTLLSFDENPVRKERALLEFVKAAASTGMGEFIDVVNNIKKIENITEKDVFLTYTLKTAKYTFECPLLVGAILAGAKSEELGKLSRLGIILGQAFQIQDDLLDIFSTSKKIGKPVLSDLNESKKTLPAWKTYKKLTVKGKKLLARLLEKDKKTYSDLLKFRKLIKSTDAHNWCLDKIMLLLQEADSILLGVRMKKKHRALLKRFIENFITNTYAFKNAIK